MVFAIVEVRVTQRRIIFACKQRVQTSIPHQTEMSEKKIARQIFVLTSQSTAKCASPCISVPCTFQPSIDTGNTVTSLTQYAYRFDGSCTSETSKWHVVKIITKKHNSIKKTSKNRQFLAIKFVQSQR